MIRTQKIATALGLAVFLTVGVRAADAPLVIAAGDAAAQERVRYLAKGLRDALLTYRTRVAQKSGDKAAFDAAFRKMREYRASVEADCICNYYYQGNREWNAAAWPYRWNEAK